MAKVSGGPCPHRAVQELLDVMREHVGARLCLIVKVDPQHGEGGIHWRSPAAHGVTDSALTGLDGTLTERALIAGGPATWFRGQIPSDPWPDSEGLQRGVVLPLVRGDNVFGSLGIYFSDDTVIDRELLDGLDRFTTLMWPLLRWDSMDGHTQTHESAGFVAQDPQWAHQVNNVLGSIVLHADLALTLHKKQPGDRVSQLLEEICAETIRCAQVVQQYGSH
ncbi:GAF domain-containing protein [Dyella terrae]